MTRLSRSWYSRGCLNRRGAEVSVRADATKRVLYEEFARLGKAVASPKRIELLDLLVQGERTVEGLARAAGMSVANTSAHLQVLRLARLVEVRKDGTKVFCRPAGDDVARFVSALRDLGGARLAEVQRVARDYFAGSGEMEPVTREDLARRLRRGDVVVLDVRPSEEYAAGHVPGAISIPLERLERNLARLEKNLARLSRGTEVIAYCRGPYCVLAPQALALLTRRGFRARRLQDGFPEWRLAGYPVAAGAEPGAPPRQNPKRRRT